MFFLFQVQGLHKRLPEWSAWCRRFPEDLQTVLPLWRPHQVRLICLQCFWREQGEVHITVWSCTTDSSLGLETFFLCLFFSFSVFFLCPIHIDSDFISKGHGLHFFFFFWLIVHVSADRCPNELHNWAKLLKESEHKWDILPTSTKKLNNNNDKYVNKREK